MLSLTIPSVNVDTPAVPSHTQEALSSDQNEPNVANENKSDQWKSTVYATAKLFLCEAEESSAVSSPLKYVVAGLCFILENCEVSTTLPRVRYSQGSQLPQQTKANKEVIESLAPRVKALSVSLCTPVSEGNGKEETRRKELER